MATENGFEKLSSSEDILREMIYKSKENNRNLEKLNKEIEKHHKIMNEYFTEALKHDGTKPKKSKKASETYNAVYSILMNNVGAVSELQELAIILEEKYKEATKKLDISHCTKVELSNELNRVHVDLSNEITKQKDRIIELESEKRSLINRLNRAADYYQTTQSTLSMLHEEMLAIQSDITQESQRQISYQKDLLKRCDLLNKRLTSARSTNESFVGLNQDVLQKSQSKFPSTGSQDSTFIEPGIKAEELLLTDCGMLQGKDGSNEIGRFSTRRHSKPDTHSTNTVINRKESLKLESTRPQKPIDSNNQRVGDVVVNAALQEPKQNKDAHTSERSKVSPREKKLVPALSEKPISHPEPPKMTVTSTQSNFSSAKAPQSHLPTQAKPTVSADRTSEVSPKSDSESEPEQSSDKPTKIMILEAGKEGVEMAHSSGHWSWHLDCPENITNWRPLSLGLRSHDVLLPAKMSGMKVKFHLWRMSCGGVEVKLELICDTYNKNLSLQNNLLPLGGTVETRFFDSKTNDLIGEGNGRFYFKNLGTVEKICRITKSKFSETPPRLEVVLIPSSSKF